MRRDKGERLVGAVKESDYSDAGDLARLRVIWSVLGDCQRTEEIQKIARLVSDEIDSRYDLLSVEIEEPDEREVICWQMVRPDGTILGQWMVPRDSYWQPTFRPQEWPLEQHGWACRV